MAYGIPMTPGGATDIARQNGGEELFRSMQTLLAGHRIDAAMYALVESLGVYVCNVCETEEEANQVAQVMVRDALNYVALNYAEVRAQIAIMRQQRAVNPGAGDVQ